MLVLLFWTPLKILTSARPCRGAFSMLTPGGLRPYLWTSDRPSRRAGTRRSQEPPIAALVSREIQPRVGRAAPLRPAPGVHRASHASPSPPSASSSSPSPPPAPERCRRPP